jgi:hypothetical protein
MATPKPAKPAGTKKLDPDKSYEVKLTRPITVAGSVLMPRHRQFIAGAMIEAMSDEDRASITVL